MKQVDQSSHINSITVIEHLQIQTFSTAWVVNVDEKVAKLLLQAIFHFLSLCLEVWSGFMSPGL